ncbi:MAG: selenocysteine-specific translation elongation factor [candidate division Zixibacteria bacterium]|nr:selenocysteine-specific translation elongation factor [candidate division Zixibacteria bacterium]
MFVLGTAGHIDHGKSKLVEALTGIDPDRLPEEKERGMTIDLGFAWLSLPDGSEVGIVDVPGHERFVKNMVAGVGGIDAVIFVVAADDGWMPQSEEHLQILDMLKIQTGMVAITKIDLVDADWLGLVEEDIKEKVKGTILENSPVVKVSSTQKIGIAEVYEQIVKMISRIKPRKDVGKPRMYIDRVFTMLGRGTVVTGTLRDGHFQSGEEIEILPRKIGSRIRELQTHKKIQKEVGPGTRVAMNLVGVEKEKLKRGDVVTKVGQDETVETFIAKMDAVSTLRFPIKHNANLLLILGTTELQAKAKILDKDQIPPGDSGFVQLLCKGKVLARIGDHFILRLPSPQITVGGGIVLDVFPKVHKRKDEELIVNLQRRLSLEPSDLILSELKKWGLIPKKAILRSNNFSQEQIQSSLNQLEKEGKIFYSQDFVADLTKWKQASDRIVSEIEKTHQAFPFKIGAKLAELPSRLKIGENLFDQTVKDLIAEKKIVQQGTYLCLPTHQPTLSSQQKELSEKILQKFASNPLSPPTKEEIQNLGAEYEEVLLFLIEQGQIIELKDGILFRKDDFERIKSQVVDFIRKQGEATVSQLREHLSTTRKYMVPILEKLDQTRVTQREGDKRILPGG